MSEKLADELRQSIISIAGERLPTDTRESWLRRGARKAGIEFGEAKRLFYRDSPNPRASLVDRVRAAVVRKNQEMETAFAKDYRELSARLELLEQQLAAVSVELDRIRLPDIGKYLSSRCVPNGPAE